MTKCSMKNCKSNSRNVLKKDGVSYFNFPQNAERRLEWAKIVGIDRGEEYYKPKKGSLVCSKHFLPSDIYSTSKGLKRLVKTAKPILSMVKPLLANVEPSRGLSLCGSSYILNNQNVQSGDGRDLTPLQCVPETSRSVTPITDPEDEETEAEVSVKEEKEYSIVIEDPLSLSSAGGTFKQLHSHQPGANHCQLYLQPSTSTTELVIKEEIDEDPLDYKSMYYQLLDELTALKNQQLYQENQALVETNKTLGTEMEKLIETNQKYVKEMEQLMSEKQRLTEKNQSLSENIKYLSDKLQLTEKNEENRTKERVDIFSDYIEKIGNLNEKIRTLTEENKSLIERNKCLGESVRKYAKESRILSMKNKHQIKYIQRLKNSFNNKLQIKCSVIKALRNNLIKVKAVNRRLQRPQVAVQS